jgi:glutamate-ammonia-ligase adenylyltransferase
VLGAVLELASQALQGQYGRPQCRVAGKQREAGFAIVGYGKLGGLEMHYLSDLDIIFLHDSDGEQQVTDGDR